MDKLTYIEDGHRYLLGDEELPSVTTVLKSEGFIDDAFFTEEGRRRGEYVHLACHLHDMNDLDESTLDPAIVPYYEAYVRFLRDTGFRVDESEVPDYQATYMYAGTLDKRGILNNKHTIIDLKSGAITPSVKVQLGAYWLFKGGYVDCYSLQLRPDGTYRLEQVKDVRQQGQIFLAALAVYRWKQNNL
jgi:hypothetical protein